MKFPPLRIVAFFPIILLLGCSNHADIEMSEEDRQELIAQIIEASTSVEGYSSTQITEREITSTADGVSEQTERNRITSHTAFKREPRAIQQFNENENLVSGSVFENKVYITSEGTFMHWSGQWVKQADDLHDQTLLSMETQSGPLKQLHSFKYNTEEIKIRDEGDHYVLSLNLEGDEIKGRNQPLTSDPNPEFGILISGSGRPDHYKITYEIRKVDYLPIRVEMDAVYTVETDEGTHVFDDLENLSISYDPVEPIVIPQEALDTALDFADVFPEADQ